MTPNTDANRLAPKLVIILQMATWGVVGVVLLRKGAISLQNRMEGRGNSTESQLGNTEKNFTLPRTDDALLLNTNAAQPVIDNRALEYGSLDIATNFPMTLLSRGGNGKRFRNENVAGIVNESDMLEQSSRMQGSPGSPVSQESPRSAGSAGSAGSLGSSETSRSPEATQTLGILGPVGTAQTIRGIGKKKLPASPVQRYISPDAKRQGSVDANSLEGRRGAIQRSNEIRTYTEVTRKRDRYRERPLKGKPEKRTRTVREKSLAIVNDRNRSSAFEEPEETLSVVGRITEAFNFTADSSNYENYDLNDPQEFENNFLRNTDTSISVEEMNNSKTDYPLHSPRPVSQTGAAIAITMLAIGIVMLLLGPIIVIFRAIEARRRSREEKRSSISRFGGDSPPSYEQVLLMDQAPRYSTLRLDAIDESSSPVSL